MQVLHKLLCIVYFTKKQLHHQTRIRISKDTGAFFFLFISKRLFLYLSCLLTLLISQPVFAQNAIVTENQKTGNPSSEWNITGPNGDTTIQGFTTAISVNKGETVHFKISTNAAAYTINIYRLGYYQGNGARKVGTGTITATLPQTQPAYLFDAATGLVDCGNWSESAHWDVPSDAVSGLYLAKLIRTDNGGASHIVFVVRDDASTSDLFFQTSDESWEAYNFYGGNSFYKGSTSYPNGHATKISYNRPLYYHNGNEVTFIWQAEYPAVQFLERNGYNISYTSGSDIDRRGDLIKNHKVYLSVGHDEYYAGQQRANVEAARSAGIHLAFLSGNEIYWKTRWEASIDGTATPYRTLVCYKEGQNIDYDLGCGGKCDPSTEWTGLWRDGCSYPNSGGCRPENALSGQISWHDQLNPIKVPAIYKSFRFWRNTQVAALSSGQTETLPNYTLGYEWDFEQPNGSYPAGRVVMSETTVDTATHRLSLYRYSSGALVFGAGTVEWSQGFHSTTELSVQQSTINLFADMGVQPGSIQSNLTKATAVTDRQAPASVISAPQNGATITAGNPLTISGTATEAAGIVAGVDVSVDGGTTWKAASGVTYTTSTNWSFTWTPPGAGTYTIKCRSFDDMGNIEASTSANTIQVSTSTANTAPSITCPGAIAVNNDQGKCSASVSFAATATGNPAPTLSYKIGATAITSPYTFSVGTATVTAVASNGVSPDATCTFTVTVTDNQKPSVTPPANVTLAYSTSGSYTVSPVTATDNCGIQSYSYSITGATTRSGTGSDASGAFNVGTSTITWTVKDVNNNVSTAQTTVVINSQATALNVAIPDAKAYSTGVDINTVYIGYSPASSIKLTAQVSGGTAPYTYNWSTGATTSSITVNPTQATTYTLTVTDNGGSKQTATKTINVVNVKCGGNKVQVCNGNTTSCVKSGNVANLLANGAYLGTCKTLTNIIANATRAEAEQVTKLDVKAFPNPTNNSFTLIARSNNARDNISLRVLNLYGNILEVREFSVGQIIQFGASYRPSTYIAEITQANQKITMKLIKQSE